MNRQPVFTDIPILVSKTFDPPLVDGKAYLLDNIPPTSIFTATDASGSLIERVTVSATGDPINSSVSDKLIYLCIYDSIETKWSLYKTSTMLGVSIDNITPNPEVEWIFTGGLLLPNNFQLGIAASINYSVNNSYADYLSVTVEGSSYSTI